MTALPRFDPIPEQDEVALMGRDLRFRPCENRAPTVLARRDIERFNRDGFLAGIRIFDHVEIAAHRRYFDGLLERVLAAGRDSYSISTAHLTYGSVWDLLTEPRIVAVVGDLLGDDVIGWGSHYFCKLPGDGKEVSWHQDASYWPLTPSMAVTVWLAIDDADAENGCMRVIPGSHLHGHLEWRPSDAEERNLLNQTIADAEKLGAPVDVELRAGEVSVHADLLVHGSRANDSTRRRCGLTLRYCPPEVRAGMGWNAKGVVVRGSDPSGHWSNPPRPEGE